MEGLNLFLTLVSTAATVIATVITVRQYRQKPGSGNAVPQGPNALLSMPRAGSPVSPYPLQQPMQFRPMPAKQPSGQPVQFGKGWLTLACFPWLNFGAWIWAAMKTGNSRYWGYAVMYGLPLLIWGIFVQNAQAAYGPNAEPPSWAVFMGSVSWIVGIFHAVIMRDRLAPGSVAEVAWTSSPSEARDVPVAPEIPQRRSA